MRFKYNQYGVANILIILGILVILGVIIGGAFYLKNFQLKKEQVQVLTKNNQTPLPEEITSPNSGLTQQPNLSSSKLESSLRQLLEATDQARFAATREIELKDDKVFVTIETFSEGYKLSSEVGESKTVYKNYMDAYIFINKLKDLSNSPEVIRISPPVKPHADTVSP